MAKSNTLAEELQQSSSSLSPEIVANLDKQLTPSRLRILETLAMHGSLQQKDLSHAIGVSTTNLSNLLSKLSQIKPKLLNIEISGRTRTYSLTEEAKAYMAKSNTTNICPFTDVSGPEYLYRQTKDSLERLKELSPSDWESSLNRLLLEDASYVPAAQLASAYNELMNQLVSLALTDQAGVIDRIYDYIGNTILISGIKAKIDTAVKEPLCRLMPLYQLEKQDPKQAQELMNEIIAELYPSVMKAPSPYTRNVSDAQYNALLRAVVQMRNDFLHCGTKAEALKRWESPYLQGSCIPGYLANMFDLISQIPRQTNL